MNKVAFIALNHLSHPELTKNLWLAVACLSEWNCHVLHETQH